jgi:hypothetical protein
MMNSLVPVCTRGLGQPADPATDSTGTMLHIGCYRLSRCRRHPPDVAHLVRQPRLLHRRHAVAAADDGDGVTVGQLLGYGGGALRCAARMAV